MALAVGLVLASGQDSPTAPPQIVVTPVAPLDAQRLADAMRAYLDKVTVHIEPPRPAAPDGMRQRLDDARRVGEPVHAGAVVRVERVPAGGEPAEVEIELIDLTTDEILIATVAPPTRDEDLYRALALKIQAMLRVRWSGAPPGKGGQGSDSPGPAGPDAVVSATFVAGTPSAFSVDVGLAILSFPISGPLLDGLEVRGRWRPSQHVALTLGTALLGSIRASSGGVDASASIVPLRLSAMLRLTAGRAELFAGPAAELSFLRISATSTTTPVRSAHHAMLALGGEMDARLELSGPLWMFVRAAAMGVLNGERYDASGVPLIDTSRFELASTLGLAVGFP